MLLECRFHIAGKLFDGDPCSFIAAIRALAFGAIFLDLCTQNFFAYTGETDVLYF